MKIDVAAAGLLAQVIPTLLIFLVLEGRLEKFESTGFLREAEKRIRVAAIMWNLASTFLCLVVVIVNRPVDAVIGWIIVLGVVTLFASINLTLARILLMEARAGRARRAERDPSHDK